MSSGLSHRGDLNFSGRSTPLREREWGSRGWVGGGGGGGGWGGGGGGYEICVRCNSTQGSDP